MTVAGNRLRRLLLLAAMLTAAGACAAAPVLPVPFPVKPNGSADEPLLCVGPYVGSALACAQVAEADQPIRRRSPE